MTYERPRRFPLLLFPTSSIFSKASLQLSSGHIYSHLSSSESSKYIFLPLPLLLFCRRRQFTLPWVRHFFGSDGYTITTRARADRRYRTSTSSCGNIRRSWRLHNRSEPNVARCIASIRASFSNRQLSSWQQSYRYQSELYTRAPAAPDPASIYNDVQLVMIKVDGTRFANEDPSKCITCGVPAANQVGRNASMDYPQAFHDGSRVLVGINIVDCGSSKIAYDQCIPETTFIYPIRWDNTADGLGAGGSIRELRVHHHDLHLGFSSVAYSFIILKTPYT